MNVDYLPQDARFGLGIWQWSDYRTIDVRLSLIPWLDGESIAMRFLDPVKWLIKLHDIGFVQDQYQVLQDVLDKMSWMVIITGPTWSGKTTTLYSMIGAIDHKNTKLSLLRIRSNIIWRVFSSHKSTNTDDILLNHDWRQSLDMIQMLSWYEKLEPWKQRKQQLLLPWRVI